MTLIPFSNIVVDNFFFAKNNPLKRYKYFLTHMHSDHYKGYIIILFLYFIINLNYII